MSVNGDINQANNQTGQGSEQNLTMVIFWPTLRNSWVLVLSNYSLMKHYVITPNVKMGHAFTRNIKRNLTYRMLIGQFEWREWTRHFGRSTELFIQSSFGTNTTDLSWVLGTWMLIVLQKRSRFGVRSESVKHAFRFFSYLLLRSI